MLDPVASIRIGMCRESFLVRGDELLNSRIANGVAGELITLGVGVHDEIVDLLVRHHLHALRPVVAEIGLGHPGGASARRAVEEILDGADHQHVVAGAGDQTRPHSIAERCCGQGLPTARAKRERADVLLALRDDRPRSRQSRLAGRPPHPCSW